MTNEQIRERCAAFLRDPANEFEVNSANGKPYEFQLMALESLCREAMAVGLEMAAVKLDYCCGLITGPGENNIHCCNRADWCRAEAQRVKEGM